MGAAGTLPPAFQHQRPRQRGAGTALRGTPLRETVQHHRIQVLRPQSVPLRRRAVDRRIRRIAGMGCALSVRLVAQRPEHQAGDAHQHVRLCQRAAGPALRPAGDAAFPPRRRVAFEGAFRLERAEELLELSVSPGTCRRTSGTPTCRWSIRSTSAASG